MRQTLNDRFIELFTSVQTSRFRKRDPPLFSFPLLCISLARLSNHWNEEREHGSVTMPFRNENSINKGDGQIW